MGLSSVFSTAVTGLQGAETTIDVAGNNVANSSTVGFKASQVLFATQFLQTLSLGSASSTNSGGTNPRQIGLGTQVAAITPNFTQGTLQISSSPADLAIQGEGFFIVQANTGEQLYTRNGKFQLNAANEVTTISGARLLGYGVDEDFVIQSTTLQPLSIPLGQAAVAKATDNVVLEGTLTPQGDIADTAEIIQSGILGDANDTAPLSSTTLALANVPNVAGAPPTTATESTTGGGLTPGVYRYKVVFADRAIGLVPDTSSRESQEISITVTGANDTVTLANLPTSGNYDFIRIYRTEVGGSTFKYLDERPIPTAGYVDITSDVVLDANLPADLPAVEATLTGNYSYYVTFADSLGGPPNGTESRPTPVIGPQIVANGRVQLTNIPVDGSGQWSVRRIYRNLSTDDSKFYFVGEIPDNLAGQNFTDATSDATILANPQIDLDGPRINTSTLLTDVLRRDGAVYNQVFKLGALTFNGRKGGSLVDPSSPPQLQITATTTVLDLVNFMTDALGIQTPPGPDPLNPIPPDIVTGDNPGGSVTSNGQIRLVSNNGIRNAVEVALSAFTLIPTGSTTPEAVSMPFSQAQAAQGQSAVADVVVFDSLGIPLNVRITAVLESVTGTETTYRWFADSGDNDPVSGVDIAVGTGLIRFDGKGDLIGTTNSTVSIDRANVPSAKPLEINLDFSGMKGLGLGSDSSGVAKPPDMSVSRQDGFRPGKLTSFIIGEDGVIRGVFDNGTQRDLGQIRLARFANNRGLSQRGQNLFSDGVNSGLPVIGNPSEQGIGQIIAGAVELSNTDIGQNLIDLITASTMYRGNARVITAAQQLLDELLNLRR